MIEKNKNGWSVNKEISLGDLLAILFAGVSVVVAFGRLDARTSILEEYRNMQEKRDSAQDVAMHQAVSEVITRLTRIEDKVDQQIQRR